MITSDLIARLERELVRLIGPDWRIVHLTLHDRGEPIRVDWMAEGSVSVELGPDAVKPVPASAYGTWSEVGGHDRCYVRLREQKAISALPEGSEGPATPGSTTTQGAREGESA